MSETRSPWVKIAFWSSFIGSPCHMRKIWCIYGREELFMRSLECYFWYLFFRLRNKNMHSREHINILLLPRVMWCDVLWHVLWLYCVMWCMWCDAVMWSNLDTILYNLQGRPMLWMLMPQWPNGHGPLTRYAKLQVAHAPGIPGTFSPAADFKGNR